MTWCEAHGYEVVKPRISFQVGFLTVIGSFKTS